MPRTTNAGGADANADRNSSTANGRPAAAWTKAKAIREPANPAAPIASRNGAAYICTGVTASTTNTDVTTRPSHCGNPPHATR